MDAKAILLWILTLLFWGSAPIFEKAALHTLSPLFALTVRTSIAAAVLVLIASFSGELRLVTSLTKREVLVLAGSGIVAGVLGMFTYFSLLKTSAASKVVPLTAAYPLVTATLAFLLFKEELSWQRILGILLTIAGLVIVQRS